MSGNLITNAWRVPQEGPSVDIAYLVAGFQENDMSCNLLDSQSKRVLGFKTVFMSFHVSLRMDEGPDVKHKQNVLNLPTIQM